MEASQKSVLEYDDIVDALSFERRQSEKRGIAIGEKRGIAIGEKRGVAIGEKRGVAIGEKRGMERGKKEAFAKVVSLLASMGKSVEEIANLTGFTVKEVQTTLQDQKLTHKEMNIVQKINTHKKIQPSAGQLTPQRSATL
jgi:DNA invertase Pin-like site-specific DNA recombinase